MNYGFVKVAAAVPRVKVADCKFNSERLEGLITIAEGKGVQILTFPEMCITGYTCGDLFAQQLLLEQAEMALIQILNSTRQLDIISILGMPVVVNSTVINAAVVIQKGKILGVVPKTYLPNYKEFYEQRWFTSALQVSENSVRLCGQIVPMGNNLLFETAETTFGIEICEDLWATVPPSSSLALQGAEIIFNLSADDEGIGKHNYLCSLIFRNLSLLLNISYRFKCLITVKCRHHNVKAHKIVWCISVKCHKICIYSLHTVYCNITFTKF